MSVEIEQEKDRVKNKHNLSAYPYLLIFIGSTEGVSIPHVVGLSFDKVLRRMIRDKNIFMGRVAYRVKAIWQKQERLDSRKIMRARPAYDTA